VATSGRDTGEDIFNPICGPIQQAIAKMFALGNNARCNVLGNGNHNTTPVLAQAKQPPVSTAVTTASSWQTASQLASMNLQGTNADDPFGMRSLLDLLLLVVFESPAALQF
jgi:hypothetical protein